MKLKAHVLAATAGLFVCAAALSAPALSADRLDGGDRGAVRSPAEAIVIFKEPAEPGVDTRGRSVTALDSPSPWPFVTEAYRRPPRYPPPDERSDQIALSLRFGDVSGFVFVEPLAPWVGRAPRYFHARPHTPWRRQAPLILNEWPHAPWFQDAPRYRHAPPHVRRHLDAARFHRARPQPPRARHQWRPARFARQVFKRRDR